MSDSGSKGERRFRNQGKMVEESLGRPGPPSAKEAISKAGLWGPRLVGKNRVWE